MKDKTAGEIAEDYAQSLSEQRELFEGFLKDFYNYHPKAAFENLHETNASPKVKMLAEKFYHAAIDELISTAADELLAGKAKETTAQAKIIQGFYRDYLATGKFKVAIENAQRSIRADPVLSADLTFQENFAKHAEKTQLPQKKTISLKLAEDEGLFFKLNTGIPGSREQKVTKSVLKRLMADALSEFYAPHFPELDSGKMNKAITEEIKGIVDREEVSLALLIATQDVQKASERATKEGRLFDKNREIVTDLSRQGNKFQFSEKSAKAYIEKMAPSVFEVSNTEKMGVIRALIKDLGAPDDLPGALERARVAGKSTGDEALQGLLREFDKAAKSASPSDEQKIKLLTDGYKLYHKEDLTRYGNDIEAEVKNLASGIEMPSIKLAIVELKSKEAARTVSSIYNGLFQKIINAHDPAAAAKQRAEAMQTTILNVWDRVRKTDAHLNMEDAVKNSPTVDNTIVNEPKYRQN